MESSRMEEGRRWLARLKSQRFDHVQRREDGRRKMMLASVGEELVVRSDPERVAARAKVVAGKMVVLMSDLVMRYAVLRW
jgi:hypothetical protein